MAKGSSSKILIQLPPGVVPFTHGGITLYRGEEFSAFTTSLEIAERFKKRHADVLRAIENLECSPEFRQRNFALADYLDGQKKPRPLYDITRDGFSILTMGFTGTEAMAWKEKYIAAFNAMEDLIRKDTMRKAKQAEQRASLEWKESRHELKLVRKAATDHMKIFVDYATAQGSGSAFRYYKNLTDMTYKSLGLLELGLGESLRDKLNIIQHQHLMAAESIVAFALQEGMEQGLNYKEIYRVAKERVVAFAKALPPVRFFDKFNLRRLSAGGEA